MRPLAPDVNSNYVIDGEPCLGVQLMLEVPNRGFCCHYRLDFIDMPFRTIPSGLAISNSREIKYLISKLAQLTSNARRGQFVLIGGI